MPDTTSFTELGRQRVELLPARTLLSLLSVVDPGIDGALDIPGTPGLGTPGPDVLPISLPTSVGDSGGAGSSSSG